MINAYTDIEEDLINNPIRVEWINQIGKENLVNAIIITYSLVIALSLPFEPLFTLIVITSVFDSIFYSLPPLRFKRHPLTSLISFSGAVGLPFLAGLAAINKFDLTNPQFILFTSFMLTYGTVKNIPDIQGDLSAGLRTTATIFGDFKKSVKMNTILLMLPYVTLLYFIITGRLDRIYFLDFIFLGFPIYWAYMNLETYTRAVKEKLHTQGFMYAVSFLLFNLILSYPPLISLTVSSLILFSIFLVNKFGIDSRLHTIINNRLN